MVARRSFPIGFRAIFRGELLNFQRVISWWFPQIPQYKWVVNHLHPFFGGGEHFNKKNLTPLEYHVMWQPLGPGTKS